MDKKEMAIVDIILDVIIFVLLILFSITASLDIKLLKTRLDKIEQVQSNGKR